MGKQDQMTDEEVSILVARVSDETARKVVAELPLPAFEVLAKRA